MRASGVFVMSASGSPSSSQVGPLAGLDGAELVDQPQERRPTDWSRGRSKAGGGRSGALQFPRGQRPAARSRRARRVERGHTAGDRTAADRGVAADVASRPVAGGQCPLAAGSGAGPGGRPTSPSSCVGTRVLSPARRGQARSRAYGPDCTRTRRACSSREHRLRAAASGAVGGARPRAVRLALRRRRIPRQAP